MTKPKTVPPSKYKIRGGGSGNIFGDHCQLVHRGFFSTSLTTGKGFFLRNEHIPGNWYLSALLNGSLKGGKQSKVCYLYSMNVDLSWCQNFSAFFA